MRAVALPGTTVGAKPLKKCPGAAVVSGTVCMDTYGATVWRVPDPTGVNNGLVRQGLLEAAGAS
jgi:hypothetical protein